MEYVTRQTLIAKIRNQHDDQSWEDFVYFYERYIFVVVHKMGIPYNECDDLVQKVLLELWKKLPAFEYMPDKCKFRTWMNTIIRNVVVDAIRKNQRHQNDIQRASLKQINDNTDDCYLPDIYNIAQEEWETHIANLAWENVKEDFTGKTAECFLLLCEGKSLDMITAQLGIKKNTIHVYRNRVKEKLHKEIRRLDNELS